MARRPRSRASRAERRMLKERAASAIKHGLPVPAPPAARARVADVGSTRVAHASSVPPSRRPGGSANRRMPLAVKLLGIGLLLLGVIYALTLFRDRHSDTDAATPPSEADAASAPSRASTPLAAPSAQAIATREVASSSASNGSLAARPSAPAPPLAAAVRVPSPRSPLAATVATDATERNAPAPMARKVLGIVNSGTPSRGTAATVLPAPAGPPPRK